MDPQQRLLLKVTYEALESAGVPAATLAGSKTGVFVGVATSDFGDRLAALGPDVDAYWSIGNACSIAANRLSHAFDLHGPSKAIDTACSSSLTALHLACLSVAAGECGIALVAGVNLMFTPAISISFSKAGATSPTGFMVGQIIARCGASTAQGGCANNKLDRKLAAFVAQVAIERPDVGFHLQNP